MDYATITLSVKRGVDASVLEKLISEFHVRRTFPDETEKSMARLYYTRVPFDEAPEVRKKILAGYPTILDYVEVAPVRKLLGE